MDRLFTPWRYQYISSAGKLDGCIFCELQKSGDDAENRILFRGRYCFVILNTFPYTNGHSMIVPYEHLDRLDLLSDDGAQEMMTLTRRMETALREIYQPDGVNLGMNIGRAAGAGVAGHIHMHILPRWFADANFMTTIGETRMLPESLEQTYEKLKKKF